MVVTAGRRNTNIGPSRACGTPTASCQGDPAIRTKTPGRRPRDFSEIGCQRVNQTLAQNEWPARSGPPSFPMLEGGSVTAYRSAMLNRRAKATATAPMASTMLAGSGTFVPSGGQVFPKLAAHRA